MIIAYSDYACQGVPSTDLFLLAASLRAHGGALKDVPVRLYLRKGSELSDAMSTKAERLGVAIQSYVPDEGTSEFPFVAKGFAAAKGEKESEGHSELLVWFDRDSIVTGDLAPLELPDSASLGYRPVNARNIGNSAGSPLDPFWARAFELGGLDRSRARRTRAYIGGDELVFYITAGIVAVRPTRGVLRKWAELSMRYASDPFLAQSARSNQSQYVFLHQAALSIAAASLVPIAERQEFGPDIMYPLNFSATDRVERRPSALDAVRTLRYDSILEDDSWKSLPLSAAFRAWLEANIR